MFYTTLNKKGITAEVRDLIRRDIIGTMETRDIDYCLEHIAELSQEIHTAYLAADYNQHVCKYAAFQMEDVLTTLKNKLNF